MQRKEVGKRVVLAIDGRIQEKENGKLTGKWISFHKGDAGRVVKTKVVVSRWSSKVKIYSVRLKDRGVIDLRSNCLMFSDVKKMSEKFLTEGESLFP